MCLNLDYVHISDTILKLKDVLVDGSWCLNRLATNIPHDIRDIILQVNAPRILNDEIVDS